MSGEAGPRSRKEPAEEEVAVFGFEGGFEDGTGEEERKVERRSAIRESPERRKEALSGRVFSCGAELKRLRHERSDWSGYSRISST